MTKDFDNIPKKIDQSHQDLSNNHTILDEINKLKRDIKSIDNKINIMLEILNNFTIMLAEDDEDLGDNYEDESSWIPPEQEEDWNSYDDNDKDN